MAPSNHFSPPPLCPFTPFRGHSVLLFSDFPVLNFPVSSFKISLVIFRSFVIALLFCAGCFCVENVSARNSRLFFSCNKQNDLFVALQDVPRSRFDTPASAIRAASKESAVLL